jgi:hypothetical protein
MHAILSALLGNSSALVATTVTFVAFFLIARIIRARPGVALAFAFTPLLLFWMLEASTGSSTFVHAL